jgi:hypothetical protein
MKSEQTHCAASSLTGVTEIIIWCFTGLDIFKGLGIGMLVYAFWYALQYKIRTGKSIWQRTQKD